MGFYLVHPCKSTAAYEAVPQNQQMKKLNLSETEQKLSKLDYEILANAEILLVVRKGSCEISIYPSGKLLIKIEEQSEAEKIASELEGIIFSNNL
jgi:ArsR family metal-binding transcriptional regulator